MIHNNDDKYYVIPSVNILRLHANATTIPSFSKRKTMKPFELKELFNFKAAQL